MSFKPLKVGVIGVGDISDVYLNMISRSPALELHTLAGRRIERALVICRLMRHFAAENATADDLTTLLDLSDSQISAGTKVSVYVVTWENSARRISRVPRRPPRLCIACQSVWIR